MLLHHGRAAGMSLGRQRGAVLCLRAQHSTGDGGGGLRALGEAGECHNHSTGWKLGAPHHPTAKGTGCAVLGHRTPFPRENPALLKLVQLLRGL